MDGQGGVSSLIVDCLVKEKSGSIFVWLHVSSSSSRFSLGRKLELASKRRTKREFYKWRTDQRPIATRSINNRQESFLFLITVQERKRHFELIDLEFNPREGIEEGSRGSINRCHRACDEFIDRAFHSRTTLKPGAGSSRSIIFHRRTRARTKRKDYPLPVVSAVLLRIQPMEWIVGKWWKKKRK